MCPAYGTTPHKKSQIDPSWARAGKGLWPPGPGPLEDQPNPESLWLSAQRPARMQRRQ